MEQKKNKQFTWNKQEKHLISNNEDLLRYFWSKIRFQNDEADVNLIVETGDYSI
nr:8542_t:CDS:2 [Entrophospora candida]